MLKFVKDFLEHYFIFKSELDSYIEDQKPTSQSEVETLIRRYESEKQGVLAWDLSIYFLNIWIFGVSPLYNIASTTRTAIIEGTPLNF